LIRTTLRFSPQPGGAPRALIHGHLVEVFHFVGDFLAAADFPCLLVLGAKTTADFHRHGIARIQPGEGFVRFLPGRLALQFNNDVSDLETGALRLTAGRNGTHRHGAVKIAPGRESGVSLGMRDLLHAQAYQTQKIAPRNFLGSRNVLVKKPPQVGVADGLGRFPDPIRVVEETAILA